MSNTRDHFGIVHVYGPRSGSPYFHYVMRDTAASGACRHGSDLVRDPRAGLNSWPATMPESEVIEYIRKYVPNASEIIVLGVADRSTNYRSPVLATY